MRYLITGGAGFIGSHLVKKLLADKENSVRVLDNFSSGNLSNLDAVKNSPRLSVVQGSILDRKELAQTFRNIDFVFHLAASLGVKNVVENPLLCLENNLSGTNNVLQQALESQTPVLYASTSEVYGKNPDLPLREDGNCVYGPPSVSRWSYAAAKMLDELIAICLWRKDKLPTIGVRFFNVVGPHQNLDAGFVLPNFVQKALAEEDLTIYGDGQQVRSFTHVKDAISAIVKLSRTPKAHGEVFNVGNNESMTIEGLAHKVIGLTGSSSKIKKFSYEEIFGKDFEDIQARVPSLEKLRSVIDFKLQYGLDQIILETAKWIKQKGVAASPNKG